MDYSENSRAKQEHRRAGANARLRVQFKINFLEVTVILTFDIVTQKWVWRVELTKVHLHFKF